MKEEKKFMSDIDFNKSSNACSQCQQECEKINERINKRKMSKINNTNEFKIYSIKKVFFKIS